MCVSEMANKYQVSHWVHEERACVTVQRIVQTFNLSWSNALALLKEVPKEGHQYLVTRFTLSGKRDTSDDSTSEALRLVKSSLKFSEEPKQTSGWYALELKVCTESTHTANERDSSQFRGGMRSFLIPSSLCRHERGYNEGDSEGFASSIAVSESMKERLATFDKRKVEDLFRSELPVLPKTASASLVPKKKAATTASNFFSCSSSTMGKDPGSKAKTLRSSTTSNGSFSGKATASKPQHTYVSSQKVETTQSSKTRTAIRIVNEEKENVQNKSLKVNSITSSNVGNADDILFDEEASSEEEVEAEEEVEVEVVHLLPVSNQQASMKDVRVRKSNSDLIYVEEGDDCQDDDATRSKMERAQKRRRKRKVMVEKTSVDESGYLYTETQTVWEDVLSSEDEQESVAAKTMAPQQVDNKSKNTTARPKAMKQQSLIGFFKKK